jgi:hypothetical protein
MLANIHLIGTTLYRKGFDSVNRGFAKEATESTEFFEKILRVLCRLAARLCLRCTPAQFSGGRCAGERCDLCG